MGLMVTEQYQAPAGVYEVRFGRFSARDDEGPIVKATDYGMKVFGTLAIESEEGKGEEIPFSCDPEDGLAGWCFIFSGKPPQSNDLADIEKQMQTEKVVSVRVSDSGWAQGVFVPKNSYLGKFVRFTVRDENTQKPAVVVKEYQNEERPMVFWQFEIVAGDLTGVRVPGSCRYSIRRHGENLELSNRSSLYSWLVAAGVDFNNVPTFEDLNNTLPEFEEMLQRANVLLSIQVGDSGWVSGGQAAISPAPAGVAVAQRPESPPSSEVASEAVSESKASASATRERKQAEGGGENGKAGEARLDQLMALIEKKGEALGYGTPVEDGKLTAAGKKFAAERIAPVCAEKGIPRSFSRMTASQIKELVVVLEALKPESDEF